MNALILLTDVVEKLVLLSLVGLSVWSISTILDRRKFFQTQADKGLAAKLIEQIKKLNNPNSEQISLQSQIYFREIKPEVEKGFTLLATLGSNAPFVGLFGTVLGIIRAFAYLGNQTGSTAVMNGVSQALYATAMGLLVAIPAVIAFNVYSRKAKDLYASIENSRDRFLLENKK
jgi:biopolymer transport protein ExbB/TolQ